jgi:hypothetical protein
VEVEGEHHVLGRCGVLSGKAGADGAPGADHDDLPARPGRVLVLRQLGQGRRGHSALGEAALLLGEHDPGNVTQRRFDAGGVLLAQGDQRDRAGSACCGAAQ